MGKSSLDEIQNSLSIDNGKASITGSAALLNNKPESSLNVSNSDTVDGLHADEIIQSSNPFSTWHGIVSKNSGVNYTNVTGKTMFVNISLAAPANLPVAHLYAYVNGTVTGVATVTNFNGAWADTQTLNFMVPPGAVYSVNWVDNTGSILFWAETY